MHSSRVPDIRSSPSPAVTQAAAILRLLARAGEPLGVTTIARLTGISPSSCFNLLKSLSAESLVRFDGERKLYEIGLGVLQLARGVLGADAILRTARAAMNALSSGHELTVGLWRVTGRERLTLIALGDSTASTRIHMEVGQRQPLGAGAAGRAWLSAVESTRAELEQLFSAVRWQKPVSFEHYEASIRLARKRGYAEDREATNRSIVTLASPIRPQPGAGEPRHVLTASTFAGGRDEAGLAAIGAAVSLSAATMATGER